MILHRYTVGYRSLSWPDRLNSSKAFEFIITSLTLTSHIYNYKSRGRFVQFSHHKLHCMYECMVHKLQLQSELILLISYFFKSFLSEKIENHAALNWTWCVYPSGNNGPCFLGQTKLATLQVEKLSTFFAWLIIHIFYQTTSILFHPSCNLNVLVHFLYLIEIDITLMVDNGVSLRQHFVLAL